MSIEVVKAGIADSIQDEGRVGFQHLGINPTGAMDVNAMKIANALVGNTLTEAVLEMSFPAATLHFRVSALMSISGANFTPKLNGKNIPMHRPVLVASGSELKFTKAVTGAWCYLAVRGGFHMNSWLGSLSTNIKACAGGHGGRFLKKRDRLALNSSMSVPEARVLPWQANVSEFFEVQPSTAPVRARVCLGNEFGWLTKKAQKDFLKQNFTVSRQSDRMGYRLEGVKLNLSNTQELLSTGVSFGTIQVLPNGQQIMLAADHQTTGGYPRVAHIIRADRSRVVQCRAGEKISFSFVDRPEAEDLLLHQERSLRQLQSACTCKLQEAGI